MGGEARGVTGRPRGGVGLDTAGGGYRWEGGGGDRWRWDAAYADATQVTPMTRGPPWVPITGPICPVRIDWRG